MNHQKREEIINYVKSNLQKREAAHDWQHIQRVLKLCKNISKNYTIKENVLFLAALLHDLKDYKFSQEEKDILSPKGLMQKFEIEQGIQNETLKIIDSISYKGGTNPPKTNCIEFKIVQDADRLDAIGAIGIARTFNYGGYKGNAMYDSQIPVRDKMSFEEYKNGKSTTINHFYEKLLLIKDLLHTPEAKKIAEKRHQFMLHFLKQFHKEWYVEID
ncbi:MAG: HD domain-containing protein [Flavobacteriales bacterium]|jgi:uncharacterized protein|nr:HD domain-containing protein [Flavobacteriales bacterium]